jgi:hypothetical protein
MKLRWPGEKTVISDQLSVFNFFIGGMSRQDSCEQERTEG